MNLTQLSYELLQEAVTKGTMTLENGTIYEITSSQLITITKFLIGNTSPPSNTESEDNNIPEEMLFFTQPINQDIIDTCISNMKDLKETSEDQLELFKQSPLIYKESI